MPNADPLFSAVREILFREWDPIGVNGNELCRDEYDRYARSVCRMLESGADEFKIAAYLTKIAKDTMGLTRKDDEHDLRIAHQLARLSR